MGALTISAHDRDHRHRRRSTAASARVRTDKGTIAADTVVIACGVWSPRIARMAGASIPLTPAVHQMISVGPVPAFADTVGEITFPIVRDMDTNMYERQHGGDLEVGSYAHRPILMSPDDIPSIAESALSPTRAAVHRGGLRPPDGAGARADARDPARRAGRRPLRDQRPAVADARTGCRSWARRPRSRACGRWPRSGSRRRPGIARTVAEWMTDGTPEIDPHASDIARFYDHQRTRRPHRRAQCRGLQQDLRHRPPDGAVGARTGTSG